MTIRSPTRKFEARRAEIVTSAVAVLNRKGVRGMTLGEVAEKLQIAPNGLIYYFKNKDELARACFLNGLERLSGMLTEAQAGASVAERVQRFLQGHFAFRREVVEGRA
ncbi:MAG TPA: TetR/AcrR family transcriptional regulator, partial [Phenylobacterium sp.]|nr:TetR/AcrR family transcriptional regulator [Phenylobacterium sp.]